MHFGQIIRKARLAQRYGLQEVADKAGVSRFWLMRIEKGREPRLSVALKLCRFLSVPLDSLPI